MRRGLRGEACAAVAAFAGCLLLLPRPGLCSNPAIKGPPAEPRQHADSGREPETSPVRPVLLGAIDLFRKRISPIDGPRCGFSPTCSAFGHQAVREYGPVRGVVMTADRLMRCTIFALPGPGIAVLPNGFLLDPASGNLLQE